MPREQSSGAHTLAVVAGVIGAVFIGLAVLLYLGYVSPSLIDGITLTSAETYGILAVVVAVAAEAGSRAL